MVILPVAVPLELLIERFVGPSLGKRFPYPEAAPGRVRLAFRFGKTADPAGSWIVLAVPAEGVVHQVDEPEGEVAIGRVTRPAREFEVVADRIGVRPEVAPRAVVRWVKPGPGGKLRHEVADGWGGHALRHLSFTGGLADETGGLMLTVRDPARGSSSLRTRFAGA